MLNEIFDRAKKIYKKDNNYTNTIYMIFGGFAVIIFIYAIINIFIVEQAEKGDFFSIIIGTLIAIFILFGGISISYSKLKKFKKQLELKLTDREKVSKIDKALGYMHSRIVFTEDYIIIFNKEIFETSQVSYINPYFIKEYRSVKIMLDVYLKNEKKPKKIRLNSTKYFSQAKPIMIELEPAFEKMREANISVGEIMVR